MQGDRSKLQHNAFGVRKTPHHEQLYCPQLFTIGCHSNCPLSLSWHHVSLHRAVDVAAGTAQVWGKDFKLTPKTRKQLLVALGQICCRRFICEGESLHSGDSNVFHLALSQSMHISGGLQAGWHLSPIAGQASQQRLTHMTDMKFNLSQSVLYLGHFDPEWCFCGDFYSFYTSSVYKSLECFIVPLLFELGPDSGSLRSANHEQEKQHCSDMEFVFRGCDQAIGTLGWL